MRPLGSDDRPTLIELAPLLRRSATLDPAGLARLRIGDGQAAALVRLPFGVLAARTIRVDTGAGEAIDTTVVAAEAVAWTDGDRADPPGARDSEWRAGSVPSAGWRRLETVPDEVIRGLVRSGALALKEAAAREGVPGAQPRAEVADALLDSIVLTVPADEAEVAAPAVEISLRLLSALIRMGFLPRDSAAAIDVAGRWIRVAAPFGTVYAERSVAALSLTRR